MTQTIPATVLGRLVATYSAAADPAAAAPMRAYMRDQFHFLGIPQAPRRALSRQVLTGIGRPTEGDLKDIALGCWELDAREYQYFACDLLRRHAGVCTPAFLATARTLITTKPWWDTVDLLAAHVVGSIAHRDSTAVSTMDIWIADGDMWLVRTAILHQLRYGPDTDAQRLFRYCVAQAGHRDFFVRKAIGWALREYGKSDPDAVRDFVAAHRDALSGLSVREALKNL